VIGRLLPCSRREAQRCVKLWHRHHEPHQGELWATRLVIDSETVAVVVVGRPISPALQRQGAWEVTRLVCGCQRLVSYTRLDEDGTCYRAAGWVATAFVRAEEHTHGNRALRWLPGLFAPTTETTERVRWEIGPDSTMDRVDIAARRADIAKAARRAVA